MSYTLRHTGICPSDDSGTVILRSPEPMVMALLVPRNLPKYLRVCHSGEILFLSFNLHWPHDKRNLDMASHLSTSHVIGRQHPVASDLYEPVNDFRRYHTCSSTRRWRRTYHDDISLDPWMVSPKYSLIVRKAYLVMPSSMAIISVNSPLSLL